VHVIQVDVVGLQPAQARLDRGDYLLAVVAGAVRVIGVGLVGELGGEHEPVAASFEQLAEDGFRRPVGVDVGGVDDIAARVREQVQHPRAGLRGRPPAPVLTEGHGAQRHLRDPHAGLTQKPVPHEIPSLLWMSNDQQPTWATGSRPGRTPLVCQSPTLRARRSRTSSPPRHVATSLERTADAFPLRRMARV
jgi:hypothetical protein